MIGGDLPGFKNQAAFGISIYEQYPFTDNFEWEQWGTKVVQDRNLDFSSEHAGQFRLEIEPSPTGYLPVVPVEYGDIPIASLSCPTSCP